MLFTKIFRTSTKNNQQIAAELLITPTALADLSTSDARVVVNFMQPKRFAAGTVLIKEGETSHTDFMMLILDGEVLVQNAVASADDSIVVSIVGPGSIVGEMGVLDGAARSATCTATTELRVAILSRGSLLKIINGDAPVGARLMLAISKRLSDRLREATRKIKTLDALNRALQQELDVAHNYADQITEISSLRD